MSMESAARERAGKWFILGLIASVLLVVFFGWLATQVLAGETLAFDLHIRMLVHRHANPGLTVVMRFFTAFGDVSVLALFGTFAFVMLWLEKRRRAAVLFLITILGAVVLDNALKYSFGRARPAESFFATPIPRTPSFPSGHALFSVCLYGAVAALVADRTNSRGKRAAIWAIAVVMIGCIGFSRIYLGVHYPSDVIAGYTAAIVWVSAVTHGDRILQRRRARRAPLRVPA